MDYRFFEYANGVKNRGSFTESESILNFDFYGQKRIFDVFTSIYRHSKLYTDYRAPDGSRAGYKGCVACDCIHFDFDSPHSDLALIEIRQFVEKLCSDDKYKTNIDDFRFWFTGNKGFHIFIINALAKNIPPSDKIPDQLKKIAIFLAGCFSSFDRSVYDIARLWRVPNTINSKGGLFKVPLVAGDIFTLSLADIRSIAIKQQCITDRCKISLEDHIGKLSRSH